MRLLIDMNLAPAWAQPLAAAGWEVAHWSSMGDPRATDAHIMQFAREHDWVIFTNDLDFGVLLAHSRSGKPSVFQVRARDVSPERLGTLVARALRQFERDLVAGALISLDEAGQRVRLLPLGG